MALPISEELLVDMSVMVLNYKKICNYLGLTEEQMRSVNAGDWVINSFNRYARDFLSDKTAALAKINEVKEVAMPALDPDPTH